MMLHQCDFVTSCLASTVTSPWAVCTMMEGQALLCMVTVSGLLHCILLYHVRSCSLIVDNLLVAANLGAEHR